LHVIGRWPSFLNRVSNTALHGRSHWAYYQRVWRALREIPAGSTLTYTDLARRIGTPNATRAAVAQACASNSIAVAIPCHRVVRHDGTLSGYRWGVERKQILLNREAAS
jgi:AraC family transcriptional regulator, regulatory protein of adaptative response / methylated-DNA-[protein]-cysteine methyltransferase